MSEYAVKMRLVRQQWKELGFTTVSSQVPVETTKIVQVVNTLVAGSHLIRLFEAATQDTIELMAGRMRGKLVSLDDLIVMKVPDTSNAKAMEQFDALRTEVLNCIDIDRARRLAQAEGNEPEWIYLEAKLYAYNYYTRAMYQYIKVCFDGEPISSVYGSKLLNATDAMYVPKPVEEPDEIVEDDEDIL